MDDFEVRQLLDDLQFDVRNFKKHRNKSEWVWSCLVCGDSKVNTRKARFGVAKKSNVWVCHCFNCGYSNTLTSYLKDFHPRLYERVTVDSFLKMNPELYSLDHVFDRVSDKVLRNIFFINKFRNKKYWLHYLMNKKIKLSKQNVKRLYNMHKEYWNE